MLTYDFEKRGKMSLYEYLYNCIKNDILSGKIKAGEKLPSKRTMAKNHNISVITVENAYAQLLVEGYIFSKEKRGYFASEISGQYLNNGGKNSRNKSILEKWANQKENSGYKKAVASRFQFQSHNVRQFSFFYMVKDNETDFTRQREFISFKPITKRRSGT